MNAIIEWFGAIVGWWHALTTVERISLGLLAWFNAAGVLASVIGAALGRNAQSYPVARPDVSGTTPLPAVPPRDGMTAIDRQTGTQRRAQGGQWR